MKNPRYILMTMIMTVLLSAAPILAATPEHALENPIFLSEIDHVSMIYGAYSLDLGQFMLAYTEYDAFAKGHGAFLVRAGGEDLDTTLSFIGARDMGDIGFGFAVHRVMGDSSQWLMDLGASYQAGLVSGRAGLHNLPFTKWGELKGHRNISVGASLYLSEAIILGVDSHLGNERVHTGHILFVISPNLSARAYLLYEGTSGWTATGANAWYSQGNALFHLGYRMYRNTGGRFQFGIGFRF